ncbi:unnamed protein product [Paramecium sonneborni]|uniref:Uncharacterized protein n=1 Tax=Paramecium sonneborni TaxID=65129 RepID=A0A8S1PXL7_9CILI|nr:unnamed protein product [Paramecium sonneborni]
MSFQRIISKSPLRTQSHSTANFISDDQKYSTFKYNSIHPTFQPQIYNQLEELRIYKCKYQEQVKIIENQHLQICEMKQFISDCQISLLNFKQQLEDQLSIKENYDKDIRQLNQLITSLKQENQQLIQLYNDKKQELEELTSNNQFIINDFNKQLENTLKARIENDIKEMHNKYLREIQVLKAKLLEQEKVVQNQEVIRLLQKKCEELIQGIEQKNNYIDDLLLKYGELDERYENLKRQISQKLYEEEIQDDLQKLKLKKS